jgi:hypothetical protein
MQMSLGGLAQVLGDSIVEVRFRRRRPKLGFNDDRRMLCTNCRLLLDSISGKVALRFRAPTNPPKYNASAKGLVTAWDIMWCAYRNISMETHDIVSIMPVRNEEELNKFWEYFNDYLSKLSPGARVAYSNT